jgi:predicted HTH transcriptional regulator
MGELAREQKKERKHVDITQLLSQDESEMLEFKSTFRWDLKEDKVNRDLEKAALKSIVGFLNSAGGYLVIGVASDKSVVGLECDFETLKQKDVDGWEIHFNQALQYMIGIEYRHFLKLQFHVIEGKHICVVQIDPSTKPAFLRSEKDEFYVRNGNITTPLSTHETLSYITEHWL